LVDPPYDRITEFLLRLRCTPNLVTALAFVLGLCAGLLLYFRQDFPAVLVLWLSGLLDSGDGTMARLSGKSSMFGVVLDVTGDRVVERSLV